MSSDDSGLRAPFVVPSLYSRVYPIIDRFGCEGRQFLMDSNVERLKELALRGFAAMRIQGAEYYSISKQIRDINCPSNCAGGAALELLRNILKLNPLACNVLRQLCRFYEIDEVNILTSESGVNNGSDFWHRDGVGHRIKVFIPLYLHGSPPATHIYPSSHLDSCHPMNWEMFRINQEDPHRQPHQEVIERHHTSLFGYYETLQWSYDKIIFIDTNTIHRAGNFVGIANSSWRRFASIELMEPLQSYAANKYKLGECYTRKNHKLIYQVRYEIGL